MYQLLLFLLSPKQIYTRYKNGNQIISEKGTRAHANGKEACFGPRAKSIEEKGGGGCHLPVFFPIYILCKQGGGGEVGEHQI